MRCAIYARVSSDKRQDPSNQLPELRRYAAASGWEIAGEYIDGATGSSADRPEFRRLFEDAAQKKFGVVLVWALDRFTREGVPETFEHMRKLKAYGVQFESYKEPIFRTTGEFGDAMLALFAAIAKFERNRLIERIHAGIARARAEGTRSGRKIGPPRKIFNRDQVRELRRSGMSLRKVAAQCGISVATVRRLCP